MAAKDLYATLTSFGIFAKLRKSAAALAAVLAADAILLFLLFSLDNLLNFNSAARFVSVSAVAVINLLFLGWLVHLFAFRKESFRRLAVDLEKEQGIPDNSVINAVCFDEEKEFPAALKSLFAGAAAEGCRMVSFHISSVFRTAGFAKASRILMAALIILGLYSALFYRHAQNAMLRFINPFSQLASLNFTQFDVAPGDAEVAEGGACRITASAARDGAPARELAIVVKRQDSAESFEMRREGDRFFADLKDIGAPLLYCVKHRRDSSRWFRISVSRKPRFESLSASVVPPEYTGEKEYPLERAEKDGGILKDSAVKVAFTLPAGSSASFFNDGKPAQAKDGRFEHKLTSSAVLSASVEDAKGLVNKDAWIARLTAVEDRPPEIRFLNADTNVELLSGEKLPLQMLAEDDVAVSSIEVFMESASGEKTLKTFAYSQNRKSLREVWVLTADKAVFAPNASYTIWARASDRFPGGHSTVAKSPINIHILDNVKMLSEACKGGAEAKFYSLIIKALEKQKSLQNTLGGQVKHISARKQIPEFDNAQKEIHALISSACDAAAELRKTNTITEPMNAGIRAIRDGISSQTLTAFKEAQDEKWQPEIKLALNRIILLQRQLIASLEELLNMLSLGRKEAEAKKDEDREDAQDLALLEKLKALKKDIDKFKEDQRKIIEKTEELDKKNPEDWTKAEEELLGDLSAKEADLSKFFKAAFNDLSKLGRQDFSNSRMAEDIIGMYEELQKAGDALKKKENIEIATLNEEAAATAADNVEQNLERWLADMQDNIKWNAEQGEGSPDLKMTDLPEELTDIIGDLIESESDMDEESQDSTNSTAVDTDRGLGWGVSDGNINSMQAKGITGNVLPNNNEVAGRSGEGRSGKSSGQFVGDNAIGKGGRKTPTRLTESPFEQGTIKDTSKEAQGGATGGGKQSGVGHEGLRGKTPDNNRDLEQRIAGRPEMKQKAEALLRKLTVQNLPTGDLEEAIEKMDKLSKYGAKGKGIEFRQIRDDLLSSLMDAKAAVNEAVKSDTDKANTRKRKDSIFKYSGSESTPPGYEDAVEAYFKSLAENED